MSSHRNRKSILRKITDSLSFIVPNHILDKNSSNKQNHQESSHLSHSQTAQEASHGKLDHPKYDVDLDNENSDSDNSEISLSTSGVSSLNPKTKHETNLKGMETRAATKRSIPTDSCIEPSSRKRICVQVPSGSASGAVSSDSFLLQNEPAQSSISYGGQYPSITRTFQTHTPVKYEVEDKRASNSQTAASIVLGSTARKMLQRLEKFRTPLKMASTLPARSNEYKSTYANDVWKASRYPPYMNAFKRYKMMISKTRDQMSDRNVYQEEPSKPSTIVPQEFKPVVHEKPKETIEINDKQEPFTNKFPPSSSTKITEATLFDNTRSYKNMAYQFSDPIQITSSPAGYSGIPDSFTFSQPILLTCSLPKETSSLPSSVVTSKREADTKLVDLPKKSLKFNSDSIWRCSNCYMEMPESKSACSKCWLPRNINDENEAKEDETEDKNNSYDGSSSSSSDHESSEAEENVDLDVSTPSVKVKKVEEKPLVPAVVSTQKKWECDTCMVENEESLVKCKCCSANKPGSKPSTAPTLAKPAFTGFGKLIKSDNWECPTCLVSNKQELVVCACCQTKNPNNKENDRTDADSKAKPTFQFGTKPTATTTEEKAPTFTFSFGTKPTNQSEGEKKDTPSLFNFGQPSSTASEATPAKMPLFNFGTKPADPETKKDEPSTSSAGGFTFSFGTTGGEKPAPSTTTSSSAPTLFKFGTTNSTPSSTPFGSGSVLGGNTVTPSTTNSPAQPFNFGASTTQQSIPFSFGNNSLPAAPAFGGSKPFNFDATATAPNPFGSAGTTPSAPFTFGASNPVPSNPSNVAAVNPFNAASTGGSAPPDRVYRKAARRFKK